MNALNAVTRRSVDRRSSRRHPCTLPAIIATLGQEFRVKLVNILEDGALLESTAELPIGATVSVRCGTAEAKALIVWREHNRIGVRFITPISGRELEEQLCRSRALSALAARHVRQER